MVYFVNILEITDGSVGPYRTYRLYSGDSTEEIKFNLVRDLKAFWIDVSKKIDNFKNPTNMDFGQIGDFFADAIEGKDDYVTDCRIEISSPYTNITEAARFYINHLDDVKEFSVDETGFSSYGEFAKELQKVLPLLSDLVRDYNVRISPNIVDRMYDMLKW
jgi:hypothetical protein